MPADPDTRIPSKRQADERETLSSMLDFYRATVVWKLSEMTDEDLRKVIVPSGWSPLGVVKHLAYVEQNWLQVRFAGGGEENFPIPWTDDEGVKLCRMSICTMENASRQSMDCILVYIYIAEDECYRDSKRGRIRGRIISKQ